MSYFTLRIIVILMETIKDLYQTPTAPRRPRRVVGVCTGPKYGKDVRDLLAFLPFSLCVDLWAQPQTALKAKQYQWTMADTF